MNTIVWREGWLCIRHEDISYSNPEKVALYWPIQQCQEKQAIEVFETLPLPAYSVHRDTAEYEVKIPGIGFVRKFNLKDGPSTKSLWCDISPIPCPKVRKGTETRWNGSKQRWEKLLKTGWKPA